MKFSVILAAASSLIMLPTTSASWCKYYYDKQCTQPSQRSKIAYDCANPHIFANSGRYVQCHGQDYILGKNGGHTDVFIHACTDPNCLQEPSGKLVKITPEVIFVHDGSISKRQGTPAAVNQRNGFDDSLENHHYGPCVDMGAKGGHWYQQRCAEH